MKIMDYASVAPTLIDNDQAKAVAARVVIVATDAATATRLTGLPTRPMRGLATWWFATDAAPAAALTWQPGLAAMKHHLYLGTSLDAVTQGAAGTRETAVPRGRQAVQKISNKDIVALAKICKKIEEHYAAPQDIEWALEGGKFYIVQSRPITTL